MVLIGNKVVEKDIRDELSKQGLNGKSARISDLELVAIKRPGWLQIFSFELSAFHADREESLTCFGLCRDDEAAETFELKLFDSHQERVRVLDEWSIGMIRRDRGRRSNQASANVSTGKVLACMLGLAILFSFVFLAITNMN